ncbi:MAG TPA: hypothetical protein VFG35_14635 [Actinoplanes sp.]|nr:hypothetical protein [Actinoplanes sp.]
MTTPRLIALAGAALLLLGFGDGQPLAFSAFCLIALLALGELWLRTLTGEAMPPIMRIGLATAAGLVSLPVVAIVLHVSGVPIGPRTVGAGLAALLLVLGTLVLLRELGGRPLADPRLPRMIGAVVIPGLLTLSGGFLALRAYVQLPHPPEPGFTSLALNGWAADINRPVVIPAGGALVPVRVSSTGLPTRTEDLGVRVGERRVAGRALTVERDAVRSVDVLVPPPPDHCLHRIEISLGALSTVFYGRGPAVRGLVGC